LLTHRGFTCPKWFEYTIALMGVCCLQSSPARWVAIHRIHHKDSDRRPDPHSPKVGFFWSHVGWLLYEHREHRHVVYFERYVRDLLCDPFYFRLERNNLWLWVYLAHAAIYFLVGWIVGLWISGSVAQGAIIASGVLVWGVWVRTVVSWHFTWAVNSVAHVWGYQNYQTKDDSRNNWLVAIVAHGEGWHNNHHHDQLSARHGHRWWEIDVTWILICLLERLGLVWDVVRPRQQIEGNLAAEPESDPIIRSEDQDSSASHT
jgi:stearoyl-CoA desaturase (delta-9 desaturase)